MSKLNKRLALLSFSLLLLELVTNLLLPVFSNGGTGTALAAESLGAPSSNFPINQGNSSPFGLNVQAAARYGKAGSFQVPLDTARNTGAGWNREELRWDMIEPYAGQFDFGFSDEAINKSVERGLNVLGLLAYNVNRNTGGRAAPIHTMPDLDAWKRYVSAVVNRYKNKVKFWEIWNEPSDNNYLAGANPGDYARLLQASYQTIKGLDPSASVITGGISGFDVPWLEQVMQQGGQGNYDILGIHPYVNFAASPESKYWADTQLAYFMAFAARQGKPVWATEFGWNTGGGTPVDESRQGNYIARSYVEGLASGLQKMFIYEFSDNALDGNSSYGIVKTDWTSPKAAYPIYQNLVTRLSGATFKERFEPFDGNKTPIENFDSGQPFGQYANPPSVINASRSTEQAHSGSGSLKVQYDFRGNSSNYIQVGREFPIPGQPTKVGFWVYGDNQGAMVRILLRDANNTPLLYDVGQISGPGWQRREAWLPGENAAGAPQAQGRIAYPLKFDGIQLISRPDGAKFGGTIYIDDVYASSGPNAYGFRFEKGGQNLDLLWVDGGSASLNLPTNSASARVYNRVGAVSNVAAQNGNLPLNINDDMIFVEHQGKPFSGVQPGPTPVPAGNCGAPPTTVSANSNFPNDFFRNFWLRYDLYAAGARSYVWGDRPLASGTEPYYQALDGNAQNTKQRTVVYFDKSRMEITRVSNNPFAPGYVTNGLLTVELITGKVQTGDDQSDPLQYQQCSPAQVPVAGDPDDTSGPKYASLNSRLGDAAKPVGAAVTETIDAAGNTGNNPALSGYGVVAGYYEPVTKHTIARPFWDFLNDPNQKIWVNGQAITGKLFDPYYEAPGLPITEAFWAKVKVGGEVKDVLVQAFERRVLTYTPSNPPAFRVEWGNIGRHYFSWRYGTNLP